MSGSIVLEYTYRHPVQRVWRALTEREALAEWLMENDFEPRVGHRFQFRTDPAPGFDGVVHCEVLEIDEPRRLVFSWRGGPIDTVVTWSLAEVEGGTRLRIEQTGFQGLRAYLVRLMLRAGSVKLYGERLRSLLERRAATGRDGAGGTREDPACWTRWGRFLHWINTRRGG